MQYIDKKEARRMDRRRNSLLRLLLKNFLLTQALTFTDIDPYRAGVIIGVGIGGLELTQTEIAKYLEKGPDRISVFYVPMMIGNMAAGTVAMKTDGEDNFGATTACSSGTHAIGEVFRKIKHGYLDVALCGGSESCITDFAQSADLSI